MRNRLHTKHVQTGATLSARPREGATLVEVLMSLLIFSVGIVSVFTLFPVSLLSSIQATKLTNSKILSDNVVELIRTNPGYLRPPGGAAGDVWKGIWEPNTEYVIGDLVWPSFDSGSLFPTPNYAYRCTNVIPPMPPPMPPPPPTSGSIEPAWRRSGTTNDGNLQWTPVTANSHYVVDPLGRFIDGTARESFGFNSAAELNPATSRIVRTAGGGFTKYVPAAAPPIEEFTTYNQALQAFSQPDSWSVVFEEIPASVSATTVTLPPGVEIGAVSATNHRVVVTSPDGKIAAVRPILSLSGQTITLDTLGTSTPPSSPLPGNLNSTSEVGKVRVEAFNPRYSYFLTVRRPGPYEKPTVTAVVVFNRSYSFDDEEVYDANFAANDGMGTGFSGVTEVTAGPLSPDTIRVSWDTDTSVEAKPLIREGNYVFDARNVLWYQIIDIGTEQSAGAGKRRVDITVKESIEVSTPATGNASDVGRAIFLPGIVKVFEL
ncbi:MAG: hypothetical protein HON04_04425 [Planctomicrobium sp.]|nr:hypothetical protein [Planctomicrobium sp.]